MIVRQRSIGARIRRHARHGRGMCAGSAPHGRRGRRPSAGTGLDKSPANGGRGGSSRIGPPGVHPAGWETGAPSARTDGAAPSADAATGRSRALPRRPGAGAVPCAACVAASASSAASTMTGAATTGEAQAAALQYVRKISGFREPSARNAEAFRAAVDDIAAITDGCSSPSARRSRTGRTRSRTRSRAGRSIAARPASTRRSGTRPPAPGVSGPTAARSPSRPPPPRGGSAPASTSVDGRLRIAGADARGAGPRARHAALRLRPGAVRGERAALQAALRRDRRPVPSSGSRSRPTRYPRDPRGPARPGRAGHARERRHRRLLAGRGERALECGWQPDEISYTGTNVSERDLDVLLAHADPPQPRCASARSSGYGRRAPGTRRSASGSTRRRCRLQRAPRVRGRAADEVRRRPGPARRRARGRPPPRPGVDTVHFHAGSGWLGDGLPAFEAAPRRRVEAVLDRLRAAGSPIAEVNVGGGLGVPARERRAAGRPRRLRRRSSRAISGRSASPSPASPATYLVEGRRRSCSARS